jgi:vesicle-fusing ATPase
MTTNTLAASGLCPLKEHESQRASDRDVPAAISERPVPIHEQRATSPVADPVAFMPGVRGHDPVAQYWLSQVTLRLRREVCWLWRERSLQSADAAMTTAVPPTVDRAVAALDLARYERDKRAFFASDVTARYLSDRIAAVPPVGPVLPPSPSARLADAREASVGGSDRPVDRRGSFGWVARQLQLQPVECFVLAVALLPVVDSAAGQVIASCLNEPSRTGPTLALAQRLWDEPDELMQCVDPAHALLRHGLITVASGAGSHDWHAPLVVPSLVAAELLVAAALPDALEAVTPVAWPADLDVAAIARVSATVVGDAVLDDALSADVASQVRQGMRIVPIIGAVGSPLAEVAAACAERVGVRTVRPSAALAREHLAQLFAAAWLRGHAVFIPSSLLTAPSAHEPTLEPPPLPGLPLTVFVGVHDRAGLRGLGSTLPAIVVPALTYAERLAEWRQAIPSAGPLLPELARRFRYEHAAIVRVGRELATLDHPPSVSEVLAAARADLDLGSLAQPVAPRFARNELMLPPAQATQIDEIVAAMNNLTSVHYEWGTARAWNEGGLAALFAGPPGTGKTMAAEVIATELRLPLYRIDLSQVVNKYIGETEKNLRRLFDAADSTDVILFFDEADALFGRRTEVKDAHDRYANLEISYLLERMERFKGLAILATNRKKDLDEAFLRRLRFVVEFPLPGVSERLRIWRSVIPDAVDASELDFEFLAQRFALSGGHIRGIVFHACLQSAAAGADRRLTMAAVVRAVQREYEKLDRANSLEQFGPYAALVIPQRTAR